jgi:hypothetical protein
LNSKSTTPIPGAIEQLQRRFDEFRSTQPYRTRLPETFWQAAVELARVHGLPGLRLNASSTPYSPAAKAAQPDEVRRRTAAPAFVELITSSTTPTATYSLTINGSSGSLTSSTGLSVTVNAASIPTISNVQATATNATSEVITWTTD